jgi:hypothetical protein
MPDELREQIKYASNEARTNPERYINWIKEEIEKLISDIDKYNNVFILGYLGAKLIESSPNLQNQFMDGVESEDKQEGDSLVEDEHIEILLEYAMSICLALPNLNKEVIPNKEDLEGIYQQLLKLKSNFTFLEISKNIPEKIEDKSDNWMRNTVMQDTMNVRGNGYHQHISELYREIFAPFDNFLEQFYGFNSKDIYDTIFKLDDLILSKIGTLFGSTKSYDRFMRWNEMIGEDNVMKLIRKKMKTPFQLYADDNPDIAVPDNGMGILHYNLSDIENYSKIFWVIPETKKEELIFEALSCKYSDNSSFFYPLKFKAFIMNDSIIREKPLVKEDNKYYHFSIQLAFRNIFRITENLIKEASEVYYTNTFKGNSNKESRDNYIELKTKSLFEKMLPKTKFYHSLEYKFNDNGEIKDTELDILGINEDTIYIIEVKAGELNDKHKRGALKGLKDRIEETISEGSYQSQRAKNYIETSDNPSFEYVTNNVRKTLLIENIENYKIHKITVTFEHFAGLSINLKYLVESGILKEEYKWAWIVSIFDLMVFTDLLKGEEDFNEYLGYRLSIYDRNDIFFLDEIEILGFYLKGNFPLIAEDNTKKILMTGFIEEIDNYYTKSGVGMIEIPKPQKTVK